MSLARRRIGLFSTLTSTGSREIVSRVLRAVREGLVGPIDVSFVFVNRAAGESSMTDESVALVEGLGVPVIRRSAVAFEREARRYARAASAESDEAALWAWRDRFYHSYAASLPQTDLDLLLGDMWIWGAAQCAERRGVNLHPSLPTGPLGTMWYDVVWDLIAADASESGVMLHRVTTAVDRGPVVSWCRFSLRTPEFAPLWDSLPQDTIERASLIAIERSKRRDSEHPLFKHVRAAGFAREVPLMLETIRAVAGGRLRLRAGTVVDETGAPRPSGIDLSAAVENVS